MQKLEQPKSTEYKRGPSLSLTKRAFKKRSVHTEKHCSYIDIRFILGQPIFVKPSSPSLVSPWAIGGTGSSLPTLKIGPLYKLLVRIDPLNTCTVSKNRGVESPNSSNSLDNFTKKYNVSFFRKTWKKFLHGCKNFEFLKVIEEIILFSILWKS